MCAPAPCSAQVRTELLQLEKELETKQKEVEAERKKLEQMQKAADVLKSRQLLMEQQDDETEAARQRDMANAGDAAMTAMGGGVDGEPEPPTFEAVLQPSAVRFLAHAPSGCGCMPCS